jgi:polyvinyl alcohol dehydrogenase (cytochrome)
MSECVARALSHPRSRRWLSSLAAIAMWMPAMALMTLHEARAESDDWPMFGQNPHNTASTKASNLKRVDRLKVKWIFTTGGEVSARPAVVDDTVYVPDWGGNLWAVDTEKGKLKWGHQLSDYGLVAHANSRTSPAVDHGVVYVGSQEGAWLLAIEAKNGKLIWKTQLESPANDPFAIVTSSPVVVDGVVYTGVASLEEGVATNPAYPCCKSRGSVVAVNAKDGRILWRTYTVPPGYTGGNVWGSNFVVDTQRKSIFVGTGNNYAHPTDAAYLACVAGGTTAAACSSPSNHVDSVLALDMATGAIKWAYRAVTWNQPGVVDGTDDWNVACLVGFAPGQGNCPTAAGPDYDFASAPNLITYTAADGTRNTILGAGQKSGIYFALDPDTGKLIWQTQVGPGSALGGMEWGSATDGKRIYVSIANLYGIPDGLAGAGSWAALDPATGKIVWRVADPNGAITIGPVTVANGTVFVSSMAGSASAPTMLALDAETGQTRWSYAAGSSVNAGPAIADGVLYWGSGYAHLGIPGFTTNNKLYAFSVDGH